jgi:TolB protein
VYGEDGRHVYGGHVSPDGRYALFTGKMNEDGDPGHAGAPMGLVRLSDTPIIAGESKELRARYPDAHAGPVLTLPVGWEPCWTFAEVLSSPATSSVTRIEQTHSSAKEREASTSDQVGQLAQELRTNGWIAFSAKTAAGDWDLFLVRPDGSDRRPITQTPEFNEAGVRFSPEGSKLLYYRIPKSEAVDNNTYGTFELVIANADGTRPEIYGKSYSWASWGPDGRQIACLTPQGIQVVDLQSRKVVQEFPRRGIVQQLIWSPDGKRFVGTANGLGPFWNIGVLDPANDEIHALSETERYNCTPDWFPDSQHVVYARGIIPEKEGRAELWVVNADGKERHRIYAETGRHIYGACASPDGKYVLFTRSIEDLGQVKETVMAIIRWPEATNPTVTPASDRATVARVDLGPGWEPHWARAEINFDRQQKITR